MREQFSLDEALVFFNHGSFGACPRPVQAAQQAWRDEIERNPVAFLSRRSARLLYEARQILSRFLGTTADRLVFVDNATVGVNIAAHTVTLNPGDEVLATDHEYGACDATWRAVCKQRGATYRQVTLPLPSSASSVLAAMQQARRPNTRVLFISHITSPTALILPVAALVHWAHQHGLVVVVDGAHAPAYVDLDLAAIDADFYTGNCHKWLCAPRGTGFLYVNPAHHATLRGPIISWGETLPGADSPLSRFTGAQLLEQRLQWLGTRDLSGFLSVPAAIQFLSENDWPFWRKRCREQAYALASALSERIGRPLLAAAAELGQMIAVPLPACDPETLRERLLQRHAVEIPIMSHAEQHYARISVHMHTRASDCEVLLFALTHELQQLHGRVD